MSNYFDSTLPKRKIFNSDTNNFEFPKDGDTWFDTLNKQKYIYNNGWNLINQYNIGNLSTIYKKKENAMVSLIVRDNNGNNVQGSAFFISGDGFIVTANHVADFFNSEPFKIYCNIRPENILVPVSIIGRSPKADFTLLKLDLNDSTIPEDMKPLPKRSFFNLRNTKDVKVGESIMVLGNPILPDDTDNIQSVTYGIISNLNYDDDNRPESVIPDTLTSGGNSGGPIVDADGNCIGLLSYTALLVSAIKFEEDNFITSELIIPIKDYFINNLNLSGFNNIYPGGFFGIRASYYNEVNYLIDRGLQFQYPGLNKLEGIQIQGPSVINGSPAKILGLEKGDIITAISKDDDDLFTIGNDADSFRVSTFMHLAGATGKINLIYRKASEDWSTGYFVSDVELQARRSIFEMATNNFI